VALPPRLFDRLSDRLFRKQELISDVTKLGKICIQIEALFYQLERNALV